MKTNHMDDKSAVSGALPDVACSVFSSGDWSHSSTAVPQEMALTIYVESQELVTILCTPTRLNQLVLGFLYSEGIINNKNDVAMMRVCEDDSLADVRLSKPGFKPPEKRTLASGCGGGTTFQTTISPFDSDISVTPAFILSIMKQLNEKAALYRYAGGVHTAALADTNGLLVVAEDIGRHNTLDKIMGQCLIMGIPTADKMLVATGRISSEMLTKVAKMRIPIVASRSAPTDRAITLAKEVGITLIGYVRGNRLSVYSHKERIQTAGN